MIVKCPVHGETARADVQGRIVRPCRVCMAEAVRATIVVIAKAIR